MHLKARRHRKDRVRKFDSGFVVCCRRNKEAWRILVSALYLIIVKFLEQLINLKALLVTHPKTRFVFFALICTKLRALKCEITLQVEKVSRTLHLVKYVVVDETTRFRVSLPLLPELFVLKVRERLIWGSKLLLPGHLWSHF